MSDLPGQLALVLMMTWWLGAWAARDQGRLSTRRGRGRGSLERRAAIVPREAMTGSVTGSVTGSTIGAGSTH